MLNSELFLLRRVNPGRQFAIRIGVIVRFINRDYVLLDIYFIPPFLRVGGQRRPRQIQLSVGDQFFRDASEKDLATDSFVDFIANRHYVNQ